MCRATPTPAVTATASVNSSSAVNRADALPQETALHLLGFLDAVSLSKCAETYSSWRKLASTDRLWLRRCKSEFGIDGGKADYASRWQQEKRRAVANLTLYIDFLDEIYFSLAGFFALVSIFVVFPVLAVLKIDGWLAVSWTQVFGCIYGLGFVAVMFVFLRITLLATVFSPTSTLKNCTTYCSVGYVARRVVVNQDVARKAAALALVTCAITAIPFSLHLFADGYLATPQLAALLVWASCCVAVYFSRRVIKGKRNTLIDATNNCALATSSLLLAKATVAPNIPWCAAACLFAVPPMMAVTPTALQQAVFKRIYGHSGPSHTPLRRPSSTETASYSALYYQHAPPLLSLLMVALKLDGMLHCLPWAVAMADYAAWVANGPLALHARQLVQLMFREMLIPANLRQL